MMKGADLHPKDQLFTDASNEGWGSHSELVSIRVVGHRKKATHKDYRVEGGFSGPSKVQGPVSNQTVLVAMDNSTVVAYINNREEPTRRQYALSCGRS